VRYKVVNAALSLIDAAYVAGLVDGEGTVTLSRRHAADRRQLVVSVANTDHALRAYVTSPIEAGKITSKRIASDRHTPSFCYSLSNRQALALLEQIAPYLRTYKRGRASLALAHYVELTPRNGKYTPELHQRRLAFEATFLSLAPHASLSASSYSPAHSRSS
jgi:hypothetical protein